MVRTLVRSLATLAVVAGACLTIGQLSACNTVKGVGTDIHNVGSAGQNAINRSGSSSSSSSSSQSE